MYSWINKTDQELFSGKQSYLETDVETKFIPVPLAGWDAISPLSIMDPKNAPILDNWVPRPGWVETRGGYVNWCYLSSGPVESLMVYKPENMTQTLFAAVGSEIWDVTIKNGPLISLGGLANSRWQYINFTPAGGANYLYLVNGADSAKAWNGTVWSTPAITGVASSTFININAFKRRIWFIQQNTTSAWYLPTDAIAGLATELELGSLMTKGGSLLAMGTWTLDGGNGPDDQAVFITTQGQMIIYKGTDPSNANAWALVGEFDLSVPLTPRCLVKLGSDLGIITLAGLIPLSQALPFNPASDRSVAFTKQIQTAMSNAAQAGLLLFGWQAVSFDQQNLLILNVPISENVEQQQFVMNQLALPGPWCRFTGWNANCFDVLNNNSLFFGGNNGDVNLAYAGGADLDQAIACDMQCAYNYFDAPGRLKAISMIRPFIISDGLVSPTISIDIDFGSNASDAPITVFAQTGALWDVAIWDVDVWVTSTPQTITNWQGASGLGTALAVRMKVNVLASLDTSAITESGQSIPILKVNMFEALMSFGGPV